MAEKVSVRGLPELRRAFRELDDDVKKGLGKELTKAAVPARDEARSLVQRYQGASVNTIRVSRRGPVVAVQQSAKKTTGLRSDFGALQMRTVLIPAVHDKANEVFERVDEALGRWIQERGF